MAIPWGVILFLVIFIIIVLGIIAVKIYILLIINKRTKKSNFVLPSSIRIGLGPAPPLPPPSEVSSLPPQLKDRLKKLELTYAEVLQITNNLRIKLGQGGFGAVYHGKLKDGKQVAVKLLSSTSHQGAQEFLNEVGSLSQVHHKNLVTLVGYCCQANERCLIYEFMSKGNLEDRLHGLPSEQEPLNWVVRLKIAVGAAKGFNYLHNDCNPTIIHRDVKCSNILLDDNLVAKVADFGLAKSLTELALTHVTTGVKGTFGYLDPEYAQTKRLTEKSDVYSFGVILLELLSGEKAIMQREGEFEHIVQWAKPYIVSGTIGNILDKNLGDVVNKDTLQAVGVLALQCVAYKSAERPFFDEVLHTLESALKEEAPQQAHLLVEEDSSADVSMKSYTVARTINDPRFNDDSTIPMLNSRSQDSFSS